MTTIFFARKTRTIMKGVCYKMETEEKVVIGLSLVMSGWLLRSFSVMHQAKTDPTYQMLLKHLMEQSVK
jgi:hypothetical protein